MLQGTGLASCSLAQTGTVGSQSLWTDIDLDVVDAVVQKLGKRERSSFRLVCTAWKSSIDCCIRELRSVKLKGSAVSTKRDRELFKV